MHEDSQRARRSGFGGVIAIAFGGAAFGEYISGYLIEKSLSVDNVFVWSMLFTSMAIPLKYQHRVHRRREPGSRLRTFCRTEAGLDRLASSNADMHGDAILDATSLSGLL